MPWRRHTIAVEAPGGACGLGVTPSLTPWARLRRLPFVAWIILYCAVVWGVFGALLGAVAPNLRAQMGLSFDQIGWLMALWTSGGALGSVLGGAVAKRFAAQRLLSAYAALVLLGVAGVMVAPGFVTLAFSLVVIAVFETALFTLGHGLMAEVSDDPEERTRIISLMDVAYSAGSIVSPLLVMGVLLLTPWWRAPYAVFGALAIGLWWMTQQRARLAHVAFREHASATDDGPRGYRDLLGRRLVRRVLVAGVFSGFIEWGQYFWFVSYASTALGQTEQSARFALGFLMAGMTVGRIWQAFVHSRWTMRQKLQGLSALATLALLALWAMPAGAPLSAIAVVNFLSGLGVSVGFPILLGTALRGHPEHAPRLSALLMIAFTVGAQLAALLLGYLAEGAGLRLAYGVLAMGSVVLLFAVWRLNRWVRRMPD
jgi:fucose permease